MLNLSRPRSELNQVDLYDGYRETQLINSHVEHTERIPSLFVPLAISVH